MPFPSLQRWPVQPDQLSRKVPTERESRGELEQLRQRHRQEEAQAIADIAQQYNKRKAWEMGLEMEARKLGYQAAKAARAAAHWNAVATIRRDVVARSRQIGQAA
ncbi:hypothetical protein WJX74_007748 [Apatococcus lobatus]|uniref:Uncharacterized protein n=1 Tax=Apatococcus lobatus TaxID=904363 RepID=A0AAW1SGT5_9CHLO